MNINKVLLSTLIFILFITTRNVFAGNAKHPGDSHYTASGFFDIHVCNWPNRAPFYMVLYSTFQFKDVKSVEVMDAQGKIITSMNLSKFRVLKTKNKLEKRVFINQVDRPADFSDGWFSAKITLADGTVHLAKDFVAHDILPIASDLKPASHQIVSDVPKTLSWAAVKGASYYQVFIKDKWDEDKVIFSSKILKEPKAVLPKDLLEYGGYYSWRVHARDVNEDVKLGDFNIGSLTSWQEFTITD